MVGRRIRPEMLTQLSAARNRANQTPPPRAAPARRRRQDDALWRLVGVQPHRRRLAGSALRGRSLHGSPAAGPRRARCGAWRSAIGVDRRRRPVHDRSHLAGGRRRDEVGTSSGGSSASTTSSLLRLRQRLLELQLLVVVALAAGELVGVALLLARRRCRAGTRRCAACRATGRSRRATPCRSVRRSRAVW